MNAECVTCINMSRVVVVVGGGGGYGVLYIPEHFGCAESITENLKLPP